jgi:UDP-N-acetyl-D-glucosamine/UDP-N-acetyl-D-galactosamine dehydrogenase
MKIKPCVIGLGYVGLPALIKISRKFDAFGFDTNFQRIKSLKKFHDFNLEYSKKELSSIKANNLKNKILEVKDCNFFIVCVPTPIKLNKKPDLAPLKLACKYLGKILKKNDIVVFESTVYPGATEDICVPILEKNSSLNYKKNNFIVCYSPERINPGDKEHTIDKINKLLAIPNKKCEKKVRLVYKNLSKKIFISRSIKETETSKVIENIQRDLNIALMNEIFIFCNKLGLNFYNVLEQAKTKWNFGKYLPGLVGGHCLPVDPYYFSHIAKKNKFKTKVTLAGRSTNEYMKLFIIELIKNEIHKNKINLNKDKIVFAGLTYKKNVSDLRNSHALKIYKHFSKLNKNVYGMDSFLLGKNDNNIIKLNSFYKDKKIRCVVLLVEHDEFKNILKKTNKKIHIINLFNFYKK